MYVYIYMYTPSCTEELEAAVYRKTRNNETVIQSGRERQSITADGSSLAGGAVLDMAFSSPPHILICSSFVTGPGQAMFRLSVHFSLACCSSC